MIRRPGLIQLTWFVAAAGLLAGAAAVQGFLQRQSQELELVAPGDAVSRNHPEAALLTVLPGGLRAPFVSYQWIRSQNLMNEGRYFDALQRAEWICALQPHDPGVWDFQAWNMAWNISVATHTPQERWKWVYNGVTLLRDKGIPLNPKSLRLYWELGWIFYFKIGGDSDDMNMSYKERWASQMQHLLGAPPPGPAQEVIDAFRPIAQAPLDKNVLPNPEQPIQPSQLKVLLADEAVSQYATRLGQLGIGIDRGLLEAYNYFSKDDAASIVRLMPPRVEREEDKALSDLINNPAYAAARKKLLAFVRAQILYNEYKMDPQWMLHLMEEYRIPLDWRNAQSHGLYWITYGINACKSESWSDVAALNTDRTLLYSLKDMVWYGGMTYIEHPFNPDTPKITRISDLRFIFPTHEAYVRFGQRIAQAKGVDYEGSQFRNGHVSFLTEAIQMLYPANRMKEAQELMDYAKTAYKLQGPEWQEKSVKDFVIRTLNQEGVPVMAVTVNQITGALHSAMIALGQDKEDLETFREMIAYAKRVYDLQQKDAGPGKKLPPFDDMAATLLVNLLVEPRAVGYNIPILARGQMYRALLQEWPILPLKVYDSLGASYLRDQCEADGIRYDAVFPPPPNIELYRQKMKESAAPVQ